LHRRQETNVLCLAGVARQLLDEVLMSIVQQQNLTELIQQLQKFSLFDGMRTFMCVQRSYCGDVAAFCCLGSQISLRHGETRLNLLESAHYLEDLKPKGACIRPSAV